jgi:hypothetical protein
MLNVKLANLVAFKKKVALEEPERNIRNGYQRKRPPRPKSDSDNDNQIISSFRNSFSTRTTKLQSNSDKPL